MLVHVCSRSFATKMPRGFATAKMGPNGTDSNSDVHAQCNEDGSVTVFQYDGAAWLTVSQSTWRLSPGEIATLEILRNEIFIRGEDSRLILHTLPAVLTSDKSLGPFQSVKV